MSKNFTAILAISLVAGSIAATSADAQTRRHTLNPAAAAARAQVPPRAPAATEAAPQSPAVYEWGKYQGQDPDANVRLMLRRDWHN